MGTDEVTTQKPSLYDRLGGIYSIAAVVDDFIDRVMDSPVLNANAAVYEGHHRVSRAGFKFHVTELVGFASGGPQKYSGRSMIDAHKTLGITAREWGHFCGLFKQTLDKFKVPEAEQGELFAIVESTRRDIVTPAPAKGVAAESPAKSARGPRARAAAKEQTTKSSAKQPAAKTSVSKAPAAKTPASGKAAANAPAAKAPAAKAPAAKVPAAKAQAAKTPAPKAPAAKSSAAKPSAVKTPAAKAPAPKAPAAKAPAAKAPTSGKTTAKQRSASSPVTSG